MIYDIKRGVFGDALKIGDIVGVANVIEHLRKKFDTKVQFYMTEGSIDQSKHILNFFDFLKTQTDYFSSIPGNNDLNWKRVNLWDFRDIIGDNVIIPNNSIMQKKIVIFPLIDAPYNQYRNWPIHTLNEIIQTYSNENFDEYEKILCIDENLYERSKSNININKFKLSHDIIDNLNHIKTAEIFVGGDTGTSHFAWSLDKGPKQLIYVCSSRGLIHVLPFYFLNGKGTMYRYWLNMEGTTF